MCEVIMEYAKFYETYGHSYDEYESSHKGRLDFLVQDLGLNDHLDKTIADIGCGLGFIHNRLNENIQPNYFGFDGASIKLPPFNYSQVDLDYFKTRHDKFFDIALCFETLEHLTNPYACLLEIKKILKDDGILYLSIPEERTTHNTIYPGLLYPRQNFEVFLKQLAFQIIDHRVHDKCFYQNVYTCINKDWSHSQMLWPKHEQKFWNIPPHESVNL